MRTPKAFSVVYGVPLYLLLIATACVGREVSVGANSSALSLVDPNQISAAPTACNSGAAHPNVCCQAASGQAAKCGTYPDEPFHPCDSGWTLYPDPRSCCSLDDPTSCAAPPSSPPPVSGACTYACPPGWYPIVDGCCRDNGDGSGECYGWASAGADAGEVDAEPPDAGLVDAGVFDAGPAPDTGPGGPFDGGVVGVDSGPFPPTSCAPGTYDVDGSCVSVPPTPITCTTTCPSGWTPAENAPDVCCREISPNAFECFSQATGPSPGGGTVGIDAGPAPDSGIEFADAGAACSVAPPTPPYGCKCPSGTVCVTRPQSGGTAFLGCIPVASECGGTPSCGCMGCVCGQLGLGCGDVTLDTSTGSGTDLNCR
jgi:hypothetical protein